MNGLRTYCCCSVTQSCLTLCDPMDCSMPGFPVLHHHPGFLKLMSIELVMPSTHFVLCHPLLFLPSVFPSIRVFSNELALHIRWPKYWSFSFSITASNEYSVLILKGCGWEPCVMPGLRPLEDRVSIQGQRWGLTTWSFLCSKVLLKYNRDRESFWQTSEGNKKSAPLLVFSKVFYVC